MLQSQSHRITMLRFLEGQSATITHVNAARPADEQRLDDLAQQVIDVMAVRDCHRWNTEIAWQSAREALPSTSDADLIEIIDRVQFELLAQ